MEFKQHTVLTKLSCFPPSKKIKIKIKRGNYHAFGTFEGNILRFMGLFFYPPPKARAFRQHHVGCALKEEAY